MFNSCKILAGLLIATVPLVAQDNFVESAAQLGIQHYHRGKMGGGVAIFDFNNDGFQDIYLTGGLFSDELFKNNGNDSFTRVTQFAGLDLTSNFNSVSVVTGDINNDGYRDVFVGTDKSKRSLLFLNNGNGTFSEIGQQAGLADLDWAMGGAFADFNLDGHLDLYVIDYVQKHQAVLDENDRVIGFDHDCFPNNLYINNGDLTFSEQAKESYADNNGCGLAAAVTDLNNDNIPDIYIANDFGAWVVPNTCLINNYPDLSFSDLSSSSGIDAAIYGMGIAVGDYNRDGYLDYYVSNLGANLLYKNLGNGSFIDEAEYGRVLNTKAGDKLATSWGTALFDYDLDGYEDLFVSNGHVPAAEFIGTAAQDPNKLYRNLGDGTFEDVSALEQVGNPEIGRGMAVGDLDNDGDLDLVVAIIGESDEAGNVLIYENNTRNNYHWLKVMLMGREANQDGYGAKVKLYFQGIVWIHEIDGGSSHASQNSSIAHFGLGETETLDSLVVIWPGGKQQKFENPGVDQLIRIEEHADSYEIAGCMDTSAANFNENATYNYGCFVRIEGCLDQESPLFTLDANVDNGACFELVTDVDTPEINSIAVYPNPMRQYVSIELGEEYPEPYNLELLDLSGRTLHSAQFIKNYRLQRDNLPSGIYLLRLVSEKGVINRKILAR